MTLIPAVLDRAILAGVLLLPVGGFLAAVALEGDAGLLTVGIVVAAVLVYAAVVWLVGLRGDLARQLETAEPAPEGAGVEPLGRTAGRAVLHAVPALVLCLITAAFGFLVAGLAVAGGVGVIAAAVAARLAADERARGHRLVREPAERFWEQGGPLRIL